MPDEAPLPPEAQAKAADQLTRIIDLLVTLRVTTVIGEAQVGTTSATELGVATVVTLGNGEQKVASTAINMALGDMTQILHPDFVGDAGLAKLHADAIATARAVRADTITILTAIAKDVVARL